MIHSLKINDFRCFKNVDIKLGKYITAISGKNGLGKSTILALLGNTCELSEEKTIFGTFFRTEFSEIFKASEEYDPSGSNKFIVNFSNITNPSEIIERKTNRVTWQKETRKGMTGKRFRIIPGTIIQNNKKINDQKMNFPTIYLGLSRLYPVGETNPNNINIKNLKFSESEKEYFINKYTDILNLQLTENPNVDFIDVGKINRKKGVGINTSEYSSITNSAGQDNIGQIILSILSFIRLKNKNIDNYNGGLLLIDELDATLHPRAQIKLIDYLYKESKSLDLQIVFTTHSTAIIDRIYKKNLNKDLTNTNDFEIVYITKHNGPLEILQNPVHTIIYNDLNISKPGENIIKIPIYLEDDEAKWFFENLTQEFSIHYNSISTQLGCDTLLKLNTKDTYFSNIIFLLDADAAENDIDKNNRFKNIYKLPGKVRPEEVIYDFLINLDSENEFWASAASFGINKESLVEYGPLSTKFKDQGKDRDKYKKWFNEYKEYFDALDVVYHWKINNINEYEKFLLEFVHTFNIIANRRLTPEITPKFCESVINRYGQLNNELI
ncbi:ATP-dependent nuclease [Metaclostridioides mangenotii]|uniref:ATP-dependent nuclease n=1 Tax=Metaclostridioides mangenotii TaxID=1540 RepID=UPI0008073E53|nr:AAA family ATPase [Clostridioides mangenotii]